jgi:hypothetical protein
MGSRSNDRGEWTRGELMGPVGRDWVQLEGRVSGVAVGQGFSGSPVWDDKLGGIVGMIVAEDLDPRAKTAFMIPNQVLLRRLDLVAAVGDETFGSTGSELEGRRDDVRPLLGTSYRTELPISGLDLASLADFLTQWYRRQGLQAQTLQDGQRLIVQCSPHESPEARKALMKTLMPVLNTELKIDDSTLIAEISRGAWTKDAVREAWIKRLDERDAQMNPTMQRAKRVGSWLARSYSSRSALGLYTRGAELAFGQWQYRRLALRTVEVIEYYSYAKQS